jgi:coenzyme F420-0:L-glutamate ligase/coenzyme F420-1:gamma-L-glutamate ligase
MSKGLQIIPLEHIGDITSETNLAEVISQTLKKQSLVLQQNDILVVTQKIVSKAEGRMVNLETITPSSFAEEIAEAHGKDASHVEIILRESKRIVRMDHGVIISETHSGFICANAGVDESNIDNKLNATLLPLDPDASAKNIYDGLINLGSIETIGVIISDTWGRPWREGQVNFAIGSHNVAPLVDYRGQKDAYGYTLKASIIAVADELASAAELVMGKIDKIPVALIRGYVSEDRAGSAQDLLRKPETDMFR